MPRQNLSKRETRKIGNKSWSNIIGFVTKVFEHDGTETNISNHEVNVQAVSGEEEFKRVPVQADHNGSIYVPQKGDAVELGFLKSKTQRPVVVNVAYTDEVRAPLARSGHFRREFDSDGDENLYIEAERADHSAGDPNLVRISKKSDGLSDPIAEIVLDDSGSEPEIRVNTDSGNVVINDGSTGVIKNITTDKDNGNVTDITLERSDSVFVD